MADIVSVGSSFIKKGAKHAALKAIKNPAFTATTVFGVGGDYLANKNKGDSMFASLAKSGASMAYHSFAPGVAFATDVLPMVAAGVKGAYDFRRRRGYQILDERRRTNTVGGGYVDTQHAQTMRQAAVQQIQGNKLNARSALGGEARLFAPTFT